jgi:integrase
MAGRKSSIKYYASKGGYFTIHQGVTYRLASGPDDSPNGPTFLAALAEFRRIMELALAPQSKDSNHLSTLVELFLRHVSESRSAKTLACRRQYLQRFLDYKVEGRKVGELRVCSLKVAHVKDFIAHMREPRTHPKWRRRVVGWHDAAVRVFLASLHACLNWAEREDLITKNPVRSLGRPSPRSRGSDCRVTPEMHARALAAADEDFRELLVVCEATGCRPSELFNAEARHFDVRHGTIVYRGRAHVKPGEVSHKTSYMDKDRTIYLTGEALELVKALAARHPEGPLFRPRCATGRKAGTGRWTQFIVTYRLGKIRKEAGLPAAFTMYSYRHEAHTAFLEAGGSIEDLAAIMGNSPRVIRAHYSHLCDNPKRLRNLVEQFRAKVFPVMAERNGAEKASADRDAASAAEAPGQPPADSPQPAAVEVL